MPAQTAERPTHLIAKPGDKRSLCDTKDPLPVVWIYYADAHVKRHGMKMCPDCWVAAGGLGWMVPS